MPYFKTLRNQLGISQEAFSSLIQCTEGQLAMAETGQRELPTKSLAPLHALDMAAAQAANIANSPLPQTASTNKWLQKQLRQQEASRQLLLLELEKLEQQLQQVQHWLNTANLLDAHELFTGNSTPALQFQLLKRKAMHRLQKTQQEMARLQINLAMLQAGIATVETLIGNGQ